MQINSNTNHTNMKQLLKINDKHISITDVKYQGNYLYISVIRDRVPHICPKCGEFTDDVHAYYPRKIKHGVFNNYKCILLFTQRSYICSCKKTFNENNSFVDKYDKISKNTKQSIFEEAKYKSSFKDAAKRLNVSSTTFIRHFAKHCVQPTKTLPEVLSIDEFKGNSGGHKYLVSLTDPINKTIIDIVRCRYKDYLYNYFSKFPLEERLKVKILTTDMWDTYKSVGVELFPNAIIVADAFYYNTRHIYQAFNKTRIRIIKKYKKKSKEYIYLKKYWKLLIKRSSDLPSEFHWNKHFKEFISPITIVDLCRKIHPELEKVYELKENFYTLTSNTPHKLASKKFTNWIISSRASLITEFREASNTIYNWYNEIVNSFIINPITNKRYSNGFIEGTNNYIKSLKCISYGLSNFNHFRNKILYQHKNSDHIIVA